MIFNHMQCYARNLLRNRMSAVHILVKDNTTKKICIKWFENTYLQPLGLSLLRWYFFVCGCWLFAAQVKRYVSRLTLRITPLEFQVFIMVLPLIGGKQMIRHTAKNGKTQVIFLFFFVLITQHGNKSNTSHQNKTHTQKKKLKIRRINHWFK